MNFRDNSGTVFVLAMIMIVLCSGLLVAIFTTAMTDVKQSDIERRRTFAFTCADSGVEYAAVMLRTAAANLVTPPSSGTLTINGIDVDWEIAAAQDESGNDLVRNTISGDDFHTLSKLYHITAICTFENTYARSQQYISLDSMPIFQFFAFYENDLEILPGPEMHVRGRVHSNSDLYLGSENRIYYEKGRIRSAGDLWRHRKDRDSYPSGTVYVSPDNTPMYTNEDSDWTGTYDGTSMDFAQMALSKWDGFVMTGDHGVSKIEPPAVGTIDPYTEVDGGTGDYTYDENTGAYSYTPGSGDYDQGYYSKSAGMHVINNRVYLRGVDITSQLPAGAVTETTFYDGRENKNVTTTDIDIELLKDSTVDLGDGNMVMPWPSNGLMYAYRTDASASTPNGIRLKNGSELPSKFTMVTPNPAYVWGDFNNTSKKGAAVVSDAMNLLSNNWNDSKNPGTLPYASDTTYNLAMIGGGYETEPGKYNGGLENYPRFHESWSGKDCNLKVSFVNIWDSRYAKGEWVYGGDNYQAPNRNWYFDEDFLDLANLPPFTPQVYSLRTIAWWRSENLPW